MDYLFIDEGRVRIKIPQYEKISSKAPVFYNPAMELNRDLSVAALSVYRQSCEQDIACLLYTSKLVARENFLKQVILNIRKHFYEENNMKATIVTGSFGTGKNAFINTLLVRMDHEGEYTEMCIRDRRIRWTIG